MTYWGVSRPLSIILIGVQVQNKITLKGIILDAIIPSIKYFFQTAVLYDSHNLYVRGAVKTFPEMWYSTVMVGHMTILT
jgi:hypothetical protein